MIVVIFAVVETLINVVVGTLVWLIGRSVDCKVTSFALNNIVETLCSNSPPVTSSTVTPTAPAAAHSLLL